MPRSCSTRIGIAQRGKRLPLREASASGARRLSRANSGERTHASGSNVSWTTGAGAEDAGETAREATYRVVIILLMPSFGAAVEVERQSDRVTAQLQVRQELSVVDSNSVATAFSSTTTAAVVDVQILPSSAFLGDLRGKTRAWLRVEGDRALDSFPCWPRVNGID